MEGVLIISKPVTYRPRRIRGVAVALAAVVVVVAVVAFALLYLRAPANTSPQNEVSGPLAQPSAQPQPGCQSFKETGRNVCGDFLRYWLGHGGLPVQGYPISGEFQEQSDLDGKTYTVQYFERAVFERHPENQPPYDVLLSQVGRLRYRQKYPGGAPGQKPWAGVSLVHFQETGKTLGGPFRTYWESNGGLAQFGYPISDPFTEVSDLNKKPYTVQYFERSVFEWHPENAGSPYEVLLSQLGTLQLRGKYPGSVAAGNGPAPGPGVLRTVFLITMENHNWSQIKGNPSAPYINQVLLPQASHAEQYYNPPGLHPSEPNYLWLEAGTNFGITNDKDPAANHLATTNHLVTLLNARGISWRAYVEGISGKACPLVSGGLYATKHNPMVFFDDVTGGNNPASAYCISHERPYSELGSDLQNDSVARYNFIAPDLCDDMHDSVGCASRDSVRNGDNWLAREVPKITGSQAYKQGGVLFITWDEAEGGSDGPIGMIALSPYAKGSGYSNGIFYTHSSTLRSVEEIFGVTPLLGGASRATDLSDLFRAFP